MVLWTETDDNILDQREAAISGAGEKERRECGCTPENVVLVVLVGFGSHFDETRESLCHHKLVHQILVILGETGERIRTLQVHTHRNDEQIQSLRVRVQSAGRVSWLP